MSAAPLSTPSSPPALDPALLTPLIDLERPFLEALAPLEDALRASYLAGVLRAHGSIAAAARRAGVERANFKRLLRRYGVRMEGGVLSEEQESHAEED